MLPFWLIGKYKYKENPDGVITYPGCLEHSRFMRVVYKLMPDSYFDHPLLTQKSVLLILNYGHPNIKSSG